MQIGHGRELWPAALLKELIDNALDACEMAGIAPCIDVAVGEGFFSVHDNGPGLSAETLVGSLDYLKRVSDKAFYVSPTRGQLTLKVFGAPFAHGSIAEWSLESWIHHVVEVSVDQDSQKPVIEHTAEQSAVKRLFQNPLAD
jgi:DNA topoisomerase VI subunit B